MNPPKAGSRMTQRQWYDHNIKQGNLPAFDYPDLDKRIDSKYIEFYNPKTYSRNPQGGFINTANPNLTVDSPDFGDPYIKYDPTRPSTSTALEPAVQVDPNHKSVEIGPNVTYNPNTGGYSDSYTQKKIDPIVEQYRGGGLVKKIKGYDDGGVVKKDYSKAAGLANTAADGLTMAGQFGSQMINNDPNEQGQVDTNKAAWQGALSTAGTGAKLGGTLGSFAGPLGTVIGTGAGALAGGIYGAVKGKDMAEDANKAAEEQRIAEEKERKRLLGEQSVNAALSQRALENYAQGGEVKGPGTAKSDSIPANVKAKSFVVPAENAGLAKMIRNKVLGTPVKKANLNQKGGEPINVSNGEHIFTAPETNKIVSKLGEEMLEILAPHAGEEKEAMKDGGLTSEKAKTMLRDGTVNGKPLTDKQKRYFGWIAGGGKPGMYKGGEVPGYGDGGKITEREKLAREKARIAAEAKAGEELKRREAARIATNNYVRNQLEKQLSDKTAAKKDLDVLTKEYEALQKSYDDYSKSSDTELARGENSGERLVGVGKQSTAPLDVIKQKEDLLSKVEDAKAKVDKAQKAYDFANTESNYIAPRKGLASDLADGMIDPSKSFSDSVREAAGAPNDITAAKPLVDPRDIPSASELYKPTPAITTRTGLGTSVNNSALADRLKPTIPTDNETDTPPPSGLAQNVTVETAPAVSTQADTVAGGADNVATQQGGGQGLNVDVNGLLRNTFNYGVPLLQTALGKKYLDKAGPRPIDKFDPEYQKSIDAARRDLDVARANAKFGYTAEEQAAINQDNANALAQGRAAARNYSGGSAANAYNLEIGAINDNFSRGLASKVQNRQLQLEKQGLARQSQQYLDNLVAGGTDIKRRLYNDADRRYLQNQEVGGNLIGAGLNNLVEAGRYDAELEAYKKRLNKYGQ